MGIKAGFKMELRILYFATIRDSAGEREETLSLPEGSRLSDLKQCLGENHPRLIKALDSAIFAINREYAFDDHPLNDGDEVAIFPPVSGGSAIRPTIFHISREALDFNAVLSEIITSATVAACALSTVVLTERGESGNHVSGFDGGAGLKAEEQMERIARAIRDRYMSIEGLAIIEQSGQDRSGGIAFTIICTAAHRETRVHDAASYGIDLFEQVVIGTKNESI